MSEHTSNVEVRVGSERGFGIVFAVVFAVLGLWPLIAGGTPHWWLLALAVLMLALAFLRPAILRGPNRLWFKFGMFLGSIIAPVVMFLVFITTFVTIGGIARLVGKDFLQLKIDRDASSYWIVRTSEPQSMKNQF